MKALFDSGTSRLHIGFWEDGRLIRIEHLPYPDNTETMVLHIGELFSGQDITSVAACSVSLAWRETLFRILTEIFPCTLKVARTVKDLPLNVSYKRPETYGIDRALAVIAAYRHFENSCVVADAGTALTVDAVDNSGAVIGGYILPGRDLQAHALAEKTGLPAISMDMNGPVLGTDTESSVSLGIGYGYLAAAEQLISLANGAVNAEGRIILTGGDAECLAEVYSRKVIVINGLVLEGLGITAEQLPRFS